MRNIYHRYDLPHMERDERQMCGRLALLILTGIATAALLCVVTIIVKLLATALVIVQ